MTRRPSRPRPLDRARARRSSSARRAPASAMWLTQQDADAAADVWRSLTTRQRDRIGDRDILIAGTGIARGWPLLTRNREHFALTGVELLGT